jgi:signal transduction histidine kinase
MTASPPTGAALPRRFSTRRRLVLAFSGVVGAMLLVFGLQALALRRIDRSVDAMEDGDEQMQLALQLGAAIHEQYGLQGQYVLDGGAELTGYEAARARAASLLDRLEARTHTPQVVAALGAIRVASAELDRVFREQVAPAARGVAPVAALAHDRSHPLVTGIQRSIDDTLAQLQGAIAASRGELEDLERALLRGLAVVLAVTAALLAAAMLYLSRSVARPLAVLTRGAAVLGSGDLGARIAIDTPDEFGALAAELNAMALRLREHQARLVESEKLAGLGRVAAGIAHEINNPLQVMLGYLSLNRDHLDRGLAGQLAAVEEETLRCKQIVDGMLALSRPEVVLARQRVDLRVLCEDVAERLLPQARPAAVRLAVSGAAEALADGVRLRQAVFNLVRNAIEAAGYEGEVDVRVGASELWSEISVADTGPGIPPELRGRLFEPLFTTKDGGTGLGLSVSRAIVRAHGGDILARNGDGVGAVFVLRLPRREAGATA